MNRWMGRSIAVWVLAFAAIGCGPTDVPDMSSAVVEPTSPQPKTPLEYVEAFAWNCADGRYVVSRYDAAEDRMWLFVSEGTVELEHQPSASGAKYGNDAVSFWSKGDEARLEIDGSSATCTLNRFSSNLESIKLSGGDLWAIGNEPGWTAEIYPEWIVFTTDYGEHRVEAEIVERSEDRSAQPYVLVARAGNERLIIELSAGPCLDTMSGEEFETAVAVKLGEQAYSGCGRPLH